MKIDKLLLLLTISCTALIHDKGFASTYGHDPSKRSANTVSHRKQAPSAVVPERNVPRTLAGEIGATRSKQLSVIRGGTTPPSPVNQSGASRSAGSGREAFIQNETRRSGVPVRPAVALHPGSSTGHRGVNPPLVGGPVNSNKRDGEINGNQIKRRP